MISIIISIILSVNVQHIYGNNIMPWMCLEFCDETSVIIDSNIQQLSDHRSVISKVSFEKYTLGPQSALVDNNLTEVNSRLLEMGFETWPLLSSYPHPDEFISWMREVFRNPQPFIDSCVSEAKKYGYTGYNLDWEPTDGDDSRYTVTELDGISYAKFIDTFARGLHDAGLKLSVDVATWSPIWNYSAMASTSADYFVSMGTYTSNDNSFSDQIEMMVSAFGTERAGVGLETVNATSLDRLPLSEVQWRFQQIEDKEIKEVGIWKLPVPTGWWPMIEKYTQL